MQRHRFVIGLGLAVLALSQLEVTQAQWYGNNAGIRQAPRQGSVSKASSNAYQREVDYGPVDFTQGVSNTRLVSKSNGGRRNGGSTSITDSNAISRGVNIAGVPVGGTLTQTQTRSNGAVSRGVGYDLNVGNFGIDTSLSRDNLRNGFGLQRDPSGGLSLGLGLLNIDLSRNAQQQNAALTQAQVNAQGQNARTKANSNTNVQQQQYGGVGVKETYSQSNAVGRTRNGQTNANAAGLGDGVATNGASYGQNFYRNRRTPAARFGYDQPRAFRTGQRQHIRPKRRAQFNTGFGGQRLSAQKFNQQAGSNTHSNNMFNQNGFFQDNGASSIGSNLAQDGSSGQLSSANVAQMSQHTAAGIRDSNNAQSQSLNFRPNQQQAASTNAGTLHTKDRNSERLEANSGSLSTNNNKFGSSTNIANTNSAVFQNGNQKGSSADSSSQSIFQGANGQNANALTGSKTSSVRGPNGFVSNSASSSASASSQNGGNANANSSSNAGSGGNNAGTNSRAGASGGAGGSSGGAGASSGAGTNTRPAGAGGRRKPPRRLYNAHQQQQQQQQQKAARKYNLSRTELEHSAGADETKDMNRAKSGTGQTLSKPINNATEQFDVIDENQKHERTFTQIGDFINDLFASCISPCTIDALRQNRCCETILVPPQRPIVCCQPNPYLVPQPIQPIIPIPPRPPVLIVRPIPQLNCCNLCSYNNYGMSPCWRYGRGGYYGSNNFNPLGIAVNNSNSITIQVPPPFYG